VSADVDNRKCAMDKNKYSHPSDRKHIKSCGEVSTLKSRVKEELFVMTNNEVPKTQRALVFQSNNGYS
jgi:hypothetical protein